MKPVHIILALLSLLAACTKDASPEKRSAPDEFPGVEEPRPTPTAAATVPYPDYPEASDEGLLFLSSKGGPLGDTVFQASPREARGGKYFYSQSETKGRVGPPLTYTLKLAELGEGEHPIDDEISFYDDSNVTYAVKGHVRIDAINAKEGKLRCVFAGRAVSDKGSSPVVGAVVLTL